MRKFFLIIISSYSLSAMADDLFCKGYGYSNYFNKRCYHEIQFTLPENNTGELVDIRIDGFIYFPNQKIPYRAVGFGVTGDFRLETLNLDILSKNMDRRHFASLQRDLNVPEFFIDMTYSEDFKICDARLECSMQPLY